MAAIPAGLANALQHRCLLDREQVEGGLATIHLAEEFKHRGRPSDVPVNRFDHLGAP
jgi:hypothetical protein